MLAARKIFEQVYVEHIPLDAKTNEYSLSSGVFKQVFVQLFSELFLFILKAITTIIYTAFIRVLFTAEN